MGTGFAEAPLAAFTTLAPMGACAFIVLLWASFKGVFDGQDARKLDRLSLLPLAVSLVGFVCAAFHVANPAHAPYVFTGIGSSPLSNELAVGCVFLVVAIAHCIAACAGKLNDGLRKGGLAVVSALAVVFTVFTGLAYLVPTVPTWNSPATVVQMLGFGLLGGAILGTFTLACAGEAPAAEAGHFGVALGSAGLILAAAGLAGQNMVAAGTTNVWGSAIGLVPGIWGMFALFAICGLVGLGITWKRPRRVELGVAIALCAVGVFVARIGFYGLFMSVAL